MRNGCLRAFPGAVKTGILLNNLRFADLMDTVQEQIDKHHHEVFILVNLLIQYAKTGDVNNLGGYKGLIWIPCTTAFLS